MSAPNTRRWIGVGLLGRALYGALAFWSSLDPQPDPNTRYEAWSRYVSTDHYVLTHVLGSGLDLILAIFGTLAFGRLPRRRSRRTPGVGGDGHHRFGYRPVPDANGDLYLLCAPYGAGVPGGHRGIKLPPSSRIP
jgi:hypothetical protein